MVIPIILYFVLNIALTGILACEYLEMWGDKPRASPGFLRGSKKTQAILLLLMPLFASVYCSFIIMSVLLAGAGFCGLSVYVGIRRALSDLRNSS